MLKMIQLRPSEQNNHVYKRSFLTFYENNSSYRCFHSVYLGKHLCGDPAPLLGAGEWQVRGDEFMFLYLMPWYFQTPLELWLGRYEDMGKRYKHFLYDG